MLTLNQFHISNTVSNPNQVNELSSIFKSWENKNIVYRVSLNFSTLSNRFFYDLNFV